MSLRPLQRTSPVRPTSAEPLDDEANDGSTTAQSCNLRKSFVYAQVATKQDSDDSPVAAPAQSSFRIWALELLSIFLAFTSLAAIAILLSIHQGRPLPQWPKVVSINTLVAVFSAILKAALVMPVAEGIGQLKWNWFYSQPQEIRDIALFDQASRGPWGSILLVARQLSRPNKAYLASLGALITIGALAVDPFSQALLEHQMCPTLSALNASVPRTNDYTGTATMNGVYHDAASAPRMSAAIYEGLITPDNTQSSINIQCPSGECDFGWNKDEPYFSSLAMCHNCEDRTSEIVPIIDQNEVLDERRIKYHLKSNGSSGLNISYDSPLGTEILSGGKGLFVMNILMVTSNKTCSQQSSDDDCSLDTRNDFKDIRPFAAQCSFRPCVKSYQAKVHDHEYTEKEVGNDPVYLDMADLQVTNDLIRQIRFSILTNHTYSEGRRIDCSPVNKPGPGIMPFRPNSNIAWHLPHPHIQRDEHWWEWEDNATTIEQASKLYPRGCVWLIENFASVGLSATIRPLMEAELTPVKLGGSIYSLSRLMGGQWLQNAYNFGRGNLTTVEGMVRGLADGITAAMRNYPHEGEPIPDVEDEDRHEERTMRLEREGLGSNDGLAYEAETCIVVNWGWIAYPAILLLLQVVFCATMLLIKPTCADAAGTARYAGEFSDWKSSPLALVSLEWGDNLHRNVKLLSSAKATNEVVGKTKVVLQRGNPDDPRAARWQLVNY